MSGKWKKIIWMLCMLELCVVHGVVLAHLFLHGHSGWIAVFLSGMALMAGGSYVAYRRFIKASVKDLVMVEDPGIREAFLEANLQAGNPRANSGRLYANPNVLTPFVTGFFRQSVILPAQVDFGAKLPLVLLHECYHIKRHDTLYKYMMLACNCFLWFQPLAYFLRYISYRDIEISCDEAVVKGRTGEERYAYGRFLIDSVEVQQKGKAYSAYWNGSKAMLQCRIRAVMEEERRFDLLARAAVAVLLLEVSGVILWSAANVQSEYREVTRPENEFEGVTAPPIYTEEALQGMLRLQPVPKDTYGLDYIQQYMELYPEKEFTEIETQPDGPWQLRVKNPGRFKDALWPAVQRFWYYTENQEGFRTADYEMSPMYTTYETIYSQLLAGDMQDAVWGIIWRNYTPDYMQSKSYSEGYAQLQGQDTDCLYFNMAVHIRMVAPYLFEVVGYADLEQTIAAYQAKYPEVDLSYFPRLEQNHTQTDQKEHIQKDETQDAQNTDKGGTEVYTLVTRGDALWVEMGDAESIEVPVAKESFQDPGDPLTGASNVIREACYQCDQKKIVFAYCRGYDASATGDGTAVVYYENGQWNESTVTEKNLFKLYVVFPENEEVGYVYGVAERVVFQEACVLYRTADGGRTWEEIGMSQNAAEHSLTMDFDFLTDQTGYLAIHSSSGAAPDLLRTGDGGGHWEPVVFDEVPEYFCQAYAPRMQDGKMVLYVGMEDYGEMEGEKAYYESTDDGRSWNYQGQVIRQ